MNTIGLNNSGGENRLKFRKLSQRIEEIDIDIIHRVRPQGNLNTTLAPNPSNNEIGCYLQDELDRCRELDTSTNFRRFYHTLWPYVQSLPELMHNAAKVIDLIISEMKVTPVINLATYFQLISVFSRDMGGYLFPYFDNLFGELIQFVEKVAFYQGVPNPELSGSLFECLSYLLRYQLKEVVQNIEILRKYYGPVLGSPYEFIRNLSGKCFSLVLRKLPSKIMKSHLSKIIKNIGLNLKSKEFDVNNFEVVIVSVSSESARRTRLDHMIEGIVMLLSHTIKGVKDCLHTKSDDVFNSLYGILLPMNSDSKFSGKEYSQSILNVYITGRILSGIFREIITHIHPKNSLQIWELIIKISKDLIKTIKTIKNDDLKMKQIFSTCSSYVIEYYIFLLSDSNGRLIKEKSTKETITNDLVQLGLEFCEIGFRQLYSENIQVSLEKSRDLFIVLILTFQQEAKFKNRFENILAVFLDIKEKSIHEAFNTLIYKLLPKLNATEYVYTLVLKNILNSLIGLIKKGDEEMNSYFSILNEVAYSLYDCRQSYTKWHMSSVKSNVVTVDLDKKESCSLICMDCNSKFSISADGVEALRYCDKCFVLKEDLDDKILFDVLKSIKTELEELVSLSLSALEPISLIKENPNFYYMAINFISWSQSSIPSIFRNENLKGKLSKFCKSILRHEITEDTVVLLTNIDRAVKLTCITSCLTAFRSLVSDSSVYLRKFMSYVIDLYQKQPRSLILLKILLTLVETEKPALKCYLDNESKVDLFFKALCRSASSSSHWIRYYSLKIASFIPIPISRDPKNPNNTVMIDIVDILLDVITSPISLESEREFSRTIEKVEVILRCKQLNKNFTDLALSTCLGIINVKFQPFWEPVIKTILSDPENIVKNDHFLGLLFEAVDSLFYIKQTVSLNRVGDAHTPNNITFLYEKLENLLNSDDGENMIDSNISQSLIFYLNTKEFFDEDDMNLSSDLRSDCETTNKNLWSIIKRCPSITLTKSKTIVPMFFKFLNEQYYLTLSEDPEIIDLKRIKVINTQVECTSNKAQPQFSISILKKRLEIFLQVFTAVTSPKQLYNYRELYSLYSIFMSKPDTSIAKLAFDCILTYKANSVLPYKENIKRLLNDSSVREELLTFTIAYGKESDIDASTRVEALSLIIYTIYGRFMSKSKDDNKKSKDKSSPKKNAILQFLSSLSSEELRWFIYLMFRGLLSKQMISSCLEKYFESYAIQDSVNGRSQDKNLLLDRSSIWFDVIEKEVLIIKAVNFKDIRWEKQLAYIQILENIIKIFGFKITPYIDYFLSFIFCILENTHNWRSENVFNKNIKNQTVEAFDDAPLDDGDELIELPEELNETVETEIINKRNFILTSKIRTNTFLRISELIHQYNNVYDFKKFTTKLFSLIKSLIGALPDAISGSTRQPALLEMIHALVSYPQTITLVVENEECLVAIIKCVSHTAVLTTTQMVLGILNSLVEYENGKAILPYTNLIVESFTRRFVGTKNTTDFTKEFKLSDFHIIPSGSIKLELKLLCCISEVIFTQSKVFIEDISLNNLALLLLAMLKTYQESKKINVEEEWIVNIFRIYKTLIPKIKDISNHVPFISRLFGPSQEQYLLFNRASVRASLLSVYNELAVHPSTRGIMLVSSSALHDITSTDSTLIDSRDFGRAIPVFKALSNSADATQPISWEKILGPSNCTTQGDRALCTGMIYELIRCLYDEELAIRSSATLSLKHLVECVAAWTEEHQSNQCNQAMPFQYIDIIDSFLMPNVRQGLKKSNDTVKKVFISLLSSVIQILGRNAEINASYPSFHGDLFFLLDSDPEKDVFENITHIQIHRRARIMRKLRDILSADESTSNSKIGNFSLSHVLLPLALHHITSDEFKKKDQLNLVQEAVGFLSSICFNLPWSPYFGVLRTILKKLPKDPLKEKVYLSCLSQILEAFHFQLTPITDSDKTDVSEEADSDPVVQFTDETELDFQNDGENDRKKSEFPDQDVDTEKSKNITKTVLNTVYPWIRSYLLKDSVDHNGQKSKVVRTPIAVALTNIIRKLEPPIITEMKREALLTNLVMNIVNTLKSRDSDARDIARESLAKIIKSMGLNYLYLVLKELVSSLHEGFQRQVRNYTVRYILNQVLEEYTPNNLLPAFPDINCLASNELTASTYFDSCIPIIMECVLDDMTGIAHEDRTVEGVQKSVIRESKGNKANDILEICANNLLFRPSYVIKAKNLSLTKEADSDSCEEDNAKPRSSIHDLTTPLLLELIDCEDMAIIGRITEGLQRVAQGLSKNKSMLSQELLLYVYSTLHPFIQTIMIGNRRMDDASGKLEKYQDKDNGDDDEFQIDLPSYLQEDNSSDEELFINKKKSSGDKLKLSKDNNVKGYKANSWLPRDLSHTIQQRKIIEERDQSNRELHKVYDGASAPRLSGFNRQSNMKKLAKGSENLNAPTIAAVKYCLTLLCSCLKQDKLDYSDKEIISMTMPYLPLLYKCLNVSNAPGIVVLAMRSLSLIFSAEMPIQKEFSHALGKLILKLMFRGGAMVSTDSELVQACIKALTGIFQTHAKYLISSGDKEMNKLPFPIENIRLLLELLTTSITEITASFQNSSFHLIRAIIDAKVIIPEVYDLMNKLIDQTVLSHRKGVRDLASSTVTTFILTYPLGEKRLTSHMKQFLKNCSYEYEEGRLSALELLEKLVKLLPLDILKSYTEMIFLSLSLRLVNDPLLACREKCSEVLTALLRKIDAQIYNTFLEYATTWMYAGGNSPNEVDRSTLQSLESRALIRTGSLLTGLLATIRPDLFKKTGMMLETINLVQKTLGLIIESFEYLKDDQDGHDDQDDPTVKNLSLTSSFVSGNEVEGSEIWAVGYQLLHYLEKLLEGSLYNVTNQAILKVSSHLEVGQLPLLEIVQEAVLYPHCWVRTGAVRVLAGYLSKRDPKKLSSIVNDETDKFDVLVSTNCLYNLARRLSIAINQPSLPEPLKRAAISSILFTIKSMAYNPNLCNVRANSDEKNDNLEGSTEIAIGFSGSKWIMRRLCAIGVDIRGQRRKTVLEIFIALIKDESADFIEFSINNILKVIMSVKNIIGGPDEEFLKEVNELADESLYLLEKKVDPNIFIAAINKAQEFLKGKKRARKLENSSLAIVDPSAYAKKKREKNLSKKKGIKRKGISHSAIWGLDKKKKTSSFNDF